jgi:hypothetical protein
MSEQPWLFVSYSHVDSHWLPGVLSALERLGFSCWWDKELRSGRHVDETIVQALRAAPAVAALWSPAYVREGGYTEKEWAFATLTLGKPVAAIQLEPVQPTDLALSMARLLVGGRSLSHAVDDDDVINIIASSLLEAGIELPYGAPPVGNSKVNLSAQTIDPTFERLSVATPVELQAALTRMQRILNGNPNSPFHCVNFALIWLALGNPDQAAVYAQRALNARPDSGEIAYFGALVASSGIPFARGPKERVEGIWRLAELSLKLGYNSGLPHILCAALALDYHERIGLRAPVTFEVLMQSAVRRPIDRWELQRLISVLKNAAPVFHARLC